MKIGDILNHKQGKEPEPEPRRWMGTRPEKCDIKGCPLEGQPFVDGKTQMGPWGIMCRPCHRSHGVGLGLGRGQLYDKNSVKVGG
jgi:hypothetical protein